jgi:hypothetical protein
MSLATDIDSLKMSLATDIDMSKDDLSYRYR